MPERVHFTGRIPYRDYLRLLQVSSVHLYLTYPFVLSWSMMNSLACGCTVLGSATAPVKEMIKHRENGLLADFFDVDGLTELALEVLEDPEKYRHLGEAGAKMIEESYSLKKMLPKMLGLYERTLQGR